MRFFTLLIASLLVTTSLTAQVVLVNSPASVAGAKVFTNAFSNGWGADLTTNVWTADAVFVTDGSANPNQGCMAVTNASAINGKIALVDRGSCNFSLKALNAQDSGAIACIIFNNDMANPAAVAGMGAGTFGASVTIPTVMLSYADGQAIRTALMTGAVNISIGAVKFANDVAVTRSRILRAPNGVVPFDQVQDAGYSVVPGAAVKNNGVFNANNVTVAATVNHTPPGGTASQIYSETNSIASIESDSTRFIGLPGFDAAASGKGKFTMQYEISSDSVDGLPLDNSGTATFYISDNVFTKAGWDEANNRPGNTTGRTISGGASIEFISGFHLAKGDGYIIDSVHFYVAVNTPDTLGGKAVTAYLYLWDDLSADGLVNNVELSVVGITDFTFPVPSATQAWVKTPVFSFPSLDEGYEVPADGLNYFLGVRYTGDNVVFIGFDDNYDQTLFLSEIAESDLERPYLGVNAWNNNVPDYEGGFTFTGVGGAISQALIVNKLPTPSTEVKQEVATINMYPNPVSTKFTAEVELPQTSSYLEYNIRDAAGRLVFTARKDNVSYDKADFNVAALAAGQYYLIVRTENGNKSQSFTIQR